MRLTLLAVLFCSTSCAVPEAQRRLRTDVEAAVARSDGAAGARRYVEHRKAGGTDDEEALSTLALGDLRDALRASDPRARLAAVRAAQRLDRATPFQPLT